jgi:hypothetical protein
MPKATDLKEGKTTMASYHRKADEELVQQTLLDNPGFLRRIVERALQQVLEAEIHTARRRRPL